VRCGSVPASRFHCAREHKRCRRAAACSTEQQFEILDVDEHPHEHVELVDVEVDVVVKVIPSASTDVTRSVRATDGTAVRSGRATVSCVGEMGVLVPSPPDAAPWRSECLLNPGVLLPPP